ncbi:MAG TPA: hypothetical protein VHG51_02220 [Longimicrobiaceae bacterium]|nr:hypothetical protein [Longimicrobiaceae bacterium]
MCVLCNAESLRLLVVPASSLEPPKLAESVRVARDAAVQFVLDTVDALRDEPGSELSLAVDPEEYVRYVIARAEEDAVATPGELRAWTAAPPVEYAPDPRVQAFASSAVEWLATYRARIEEQRAILSRFLEDRSNGVLFSGVGPSSELYFRHGEDTYVALTDEDALQIAVDRVSWGLHREDPQVLLQYTTLPEGAVDILSDAQKRPEDEANQVLAGMVDVAALAEDTLRQHGHGWLVADPQQGGVVEQRFGERVVIRFREADEDEGDLDDE